MPASGLRPDAVCRAGLQRHDVQVVLFGTGCGYEDEAGVSRTECEFGRAAPLEEHPLVFVRDAEEGRPRPMRVLPRQSAHFRSGWRAEKRIGLPLRFSLSGRCGIMLDRYLNAVLDVCRRAPGSGAGEEPPVCAVQADERLGVAARA